MHITDIPGVPEAFHRKKRLGRGIGSGHGKTSTRGQKGQRARTGSRKHPGFEGGQNPLIRRIPKRGFRRKATGPSVIREIVNIEQLNRFSDGQTISPASLVEAGLINDAAHSIKLLGDGAISKRLSVSVHQASESAVAKITQAGGRVEFISRAARPKDDVSAAVRAR